jgi:hypothetical protein
MLYELRFYDVGLGRMRELHARMRDRLPPLFNRHGISPCGRWEALAGPKSPRFIYLMPWASDAERQEAWGRFYKDEEWWRVRAETNGPSEMVERYDFLFLQEGASWDAFRPTDPAELIGGMHELLVQEVAVGKVTDAHRFHAAVVLHTLCGAGARVLGVLDLIAGCNLPAMASFLAWRDSEHREAGWERLRNSDSYREAVQEQMASIGRPLLGRADVYLLQPTAYALPVAAFGWRGHARPQS